MKLHPHFREQGNLFIATMGLLLGLASLASVTFMVTGNTNKLIKRSSNLARAEAAAEGALEYAYAVWLKQIAGEPVSVNQLKANNAIPETLNFTYKEIDESSTAIPVSLEVVALDEYGQVSSDSAKPPPVTGRVPGYEGWAGNTFTYAARARVELEDNVSVGVQRLFQYTEVPLFQSMFFFNTNLVLWSPAPIVLNGLIHTNASLHMAATASDSIKIHSNATYVDKYDDSKPPAGGAPALNNPKPPTWLHSKNTQLHQVPPIQPMGGDPEQVFNTTDSNPNNDGFRELIETRVANFEDPDAIAKRRMVNKAGIVITVNGTSVTVATQRDTTISQTALEQIQGAFTKTEGRAKTNTLSRQGIYDPREGKYVDTVNVNIKAIQEAIDSVGVSGVHSNILYIQDITGNTGTNSNPKTLRLQNGRTLPADGLTIASPNPVYIQGDYNTGGASASAIPTNGSGTQTTTTQPTASGYERRPAAIIADAVMFLSNNWNDANSEKTLANRVASNTTYNTAILTGIKPTDAKGYSGGANNFPRFLEAWSNIRCTYYGSMVELFNSKVFTGYWDLGDIYSAPNRNWSFDTKFLQRPPPGSVEAVVLSRGPWTRF